MKSPQPEVMDKECWDAFLKNAGFPYEPTPQGTMRQALIKVCARHGIAWEALQKRAGGKDPMEELIKQGSHNAEDAASLGLIAKSCIAGTSLDVWNIFLRSAGFPTRTLDPYETLRESVAAVCAPYGINWDAIAVRLGMSVMDARQMLNTAHEMEQLGKIVHGMLAETGQLQDGRAKPISDRARAAKLEETAKQAVIAEFTAIKNRHIQG